MAAWYCPIWRTGSVFPSYLSVTTRALNFSRVGKSTIACTKGDPFTKLICSGFLALTVSPSQSSNLWIEPFQALLPTSDLCVVALLFGELSSWDCYSAQTVRRASDLEWIEPSLRSDGRRVFPDISLGTFLFPLGPK